MTGHYIGIIKVDNASNETKNINMGRRYGILEQLQSVFQIGRRLEDNLFVLTQCREISIRI